jgi:hypothetical protein
VVSRVLKRLHHYWTGHAFVSWVEMVGDARRHRSIVGRVLLRLDRHRASVAFAGWADVVSQSITMASSIFQDAIIHDRCVSAFQRATVIMREIMRLRAFIQQVCPWALAQFDRPCGQFFNAWKKWCIHRAHSHSRFVPPLIHFTPDLITYSEARIRPNPRYIHRVVLVRRFTRVRNLRVQARVWKIFAAVVHDR